MSNNRAAILIATIMLSAFTLQGCVVQQSTYGRSTEKVDPQKRLANYIDLAFRYIQDDNREKARQHLLKALEIDPNSSDAFTGYALIYKLEDELDLSEENFRKAVKADAKNTKARYYYSVFLVELQRLEEARKHLLVVTSDVDFVHRALALISLGQVDLKLGNIPEARQAFEKSLLLNARSPLPYLELADMDYLSGNYQSAADYLFKYRQVTSRKTPRSLWLAVRLEHRLNNRDGEASYGLQLERLFPDSKENLAYQEWRKNQ